jgi:Tfp pilus assembly protein PilF
MQTALRLRPDLAGAHVAVAEILLSQGNAELARAHLRDALKLDPHHAGAKELARKHRIDSLH